MALNRRVLEGREGDLVLPWWREVWRWANSLPVILAPGMTMTQVPGMGTEIKVRTSNPVRIFFEVAKTGSRVSVRTGMLEGEVPWIKHRGAEYLRLDGRRLDGTTGTRPELDLTDAEPGPNGRSCIAIVAQLDPATNQLLDPAEDPRALRVEHRSEFGTAAKRKAWTNAEPFHELAICYWREGQIERVEQVVQHNLGLAYVPGDDDGKGLRFFFFAAG